MSDLSIGEIKQFSRAISTAAWNLNLDRFAEKLGHDPEHAYTREKFLEFQKLNKLLAGFDAESLAKITEAGLATRQVEKASTHADYLGG